MSQPPVGARDVFVCHASEDKDDVVRPLVERLAQRYSVWFDEYELRVGDSLRRAIDQGLSNSRFGVVVLSPNFFAKEWPQRELDGLTARETVGGERVILPVWHEVDAGAVATFSPALADRLAARTEDGIDAVAEQIAAAVDRRKQGPPPTSSVEPVQRAGARTAAEAGGDAVALLRERDEVGITELLRAERRALRAAFDEARAGWEGQAPTEAIGLELHRSLMPAIDRRALSLLPLIDHDARRFEVEVEDMVQWLDARPVKSGYVLWHQLPEYATWWLGRVTGAYAIRQGAFRSARMLLNASFHDLNRRRPLLGGFIPEPVALAASAAAPPPPPQQQWISPAWEYLIATVAESKGIRERHPELADGRNRPSDLLAAWDFLLCLSLGLRGEPSVAHWAVRTEGANRLARRMHDDDRFRSCIATEVLGTTPETLDEKAADALEMSRSPSMAADRSAERLLLTGSD